jgi:RNA polymerase sigma-70 factor (ECF subfamily)
MDAQPYTLDGIRTAANEMDWESVYTENLPRVYNFFRYRTGDGPQAEDLTATTFEKAWRARARYRRDLAAFTTWLLSIARNVAADHFRKDGREHPLETVEELPAPVSLEETSQRRAELGYLSSLLSHLPDRERELVALKYGAELTNRQIARLTRLSESNVGTILNRVLQRLRAEMEAEDER